MEMTTPHPLKSTIGRTNTRSAHTFEEPQARSGSARRGVALRVLATVVNWVRDPLGMGPEVEGWIIEEEEILADLEHGRD